MQKETMDLTRLVRWEIYGLHISPTLRGYHYLVYLVEQVVREPIRVKAITKDLYPEAAHSFGTNWKAVERNSRTAILACWESSSGQERLREMARHQLAERPKTAAFLSIVAAYVSQSCQSA